MTLWESGVVRGLGEPRSVIETCPNILCLDLAAASAAGPLPSLKALGRAIPSCGGTIVRGPSDDSGIGSITFEFERRHCLAIYTILVAFGLELSAEAHRRLTDLCQCTRMSPAAFGTGIIAIHLTVVSRCPVIKPCCCTLLPS
ncbi:MAG TPA: hypothetical protein VFI20_04570 [Terracidiphilus sp.]|nr:hypothetical protein [Terracidiphilus sp.]